MKDPRYDQQRRDGAKREVGIGVTEITSQPLSTLIGDYYICDACRTVDRDEERACRGHPCSKCEEPSISAGLFPSLGAMAMMDLIQESYHATAVIPAGIHGHQRSDVAVLLHFCTFREVLLNDLLRELLRLRGDQEGHVGATLRKMRSRRQKARLFESLTSSTWERAVAEACIDGDGLEATEHFYNEAHTLRNGLIHEGRIWAIANELLDRCLENIDPSLRLFVTVHNRFVIRPGAM